MTQLATDATLATRFPADFTFGAATAAFQIEGATRADGRGPSIWDTFCATPGRVSGGQNGDVAVDHYHRYAQDIELMSSLGLRHYRLSLAWPRILPEGTGRIERRGLDFYRRLLTDLRSAGIEPAITLYHWDLPQVLQDRGGWANREVVAAFAEYARVAHAELGDLASTWFTINEPWCVAFLGYGNGHHAPGLTDPRAALRASHHTLLAHGEATRVMREQAPDHSFGLVPNLYGVITGDSGDRAADERAAATVDAIQNRLWLDATLLGHYPAEILDLHERFATEAIHAGDLDRIAQPMDVLGVNYYSQHHVQGQAVPEEVSPAQAGLEHVRRLPPPAPHTDMGWSIEPHGLRDLLQRLDAEWPVPPIMVTENGAAFPDQVAPDGSVPDPDRVRFLADHLDAVAQAIEAGVDVRGYFAWSLLDNFEWAFGYDKRFGLVHVDYATQVRTVKESGRWYADLIAAHAAADS